MIPTTTTVIRNLEKRNQGNLHIPAFESFGQKLDYRAFFAAVDEYAKSYLALGIGEGDVVTLCLAGTVDTVLHFYALNKIGAVANLVNPYYFKLNGKQYTDEVNSRLLIILDRFYPLLQDAIAQTGVTQIVLSSITEYASFLYKVLVRKQKVPASQQLPGKQYLSLDDFLKLGQRFVASIQEPAYKPQREAAILYTSGSTGIPKGVVLSNDSFNNMISIYDETNGFGSTPGVRTLLTIPPMHTTGLCHSVNAPLAFGSTVITQPNYKPSTFSKDLMKFRPNIIAGSKAHFTSLLDAKLPKNALNFLTMPCVGGEAFSLTWERKINECLQYLGAPNLMTGYGMSEFASMVISNMALPNRKNRAGKLLSPTIQAKTLPASNENDGRGELYVHSPCGMNGYINNKEATDAFFSVDEQGIKWGRTGDIASLSPDGSYLVYGRADDSLITPEGHTVYLFDIEHLAEEVDAVKECEVVAVTIGDQQVPIVHLVLDRQNKQTNEQVIHQVDQLCQSRLPAHAQPYAYKIRESFAISQVSAKRDFQVLKQETEGFVQVMNGKLRPLKLDSAEGQADGQSG